MAGNGFAVVAYTDVLREEFSELRIGVSVVEPGDFRSNIISTFVARHGEEAARAVAHSPHRDSARKTSAELAESPGEFDRSKYPNLRPVAEAVSDALFSETLRLRYLVGSREEEDETVGQVRRPVARPNRGHEHTVATEELVERLRNTLR